MLRKKAALARFLAKPQISDTIFERLNGSVEKGDLGPVLTRKITNTKSDLVVLGTHGRSVFTRATLGSNA
ncbi:universal stress protein [Parasphingorhabdus sp.]|uniref:universal stress protein n=1 Tax=Parasphingorhabdus sp. TaxID=2709688 RepID=UPI0030A64728